MTISCLNFTPSLLKFVQGSVLLWKQCPVPHWPVRHYAKCRSKGPPWRILFFGSDDFAVKSLQSLCSKFRTGTLINKLEVVTNNKENLVGQFAQEEKLNLHRWPVDDSPLREQYDLGIVVSFGHMIPEKIINAFPLGMINAHGSLLPRWRGASPIVYAIMHGDQETGVTITKIKPDKFDTGDIVRQYRCHISEDETNPELRERLAYHSSELLMECVRDLPRCLEMSQPQPNDGVTYAPKLSKDLSEIRWKTMTSREIYNKHRALSHIYPLATRWKDDVVKFLDVACDKEEPEERSSHEVGYGDTHEIATQSALSFLQVTRQRDRVLGTGKSAVEFLNSLESSASSESKYDDVFAEAGLVKYDKKRGLLSIRCCDRKSVLVEKVTVVGRKSMTAKEFYNGFISKVPDKSERLFRDHE